MRGPLFAILLLTLIFNGTASYAEHAGLSLLGPALVGARPTVTEDRPIDKDAYDALETALLNKKLKSEKAVTDAEKKSALQNILGAKEVNTYTVNCIERVKQVFQPDTYRKFNATIVNERDGKFRMTSSRQTADINYVEKVTIERPLSITNTLGGHPILFSDPGDSDLNKTPVVFFDVYPLTADGDVTFFLKVTKDQLGKDETEIDCW